MGETCIVIGAGHAAAQLVASLRQEGWKGHILMIGEEPHLPYHRPPLSKAFLSGEKDAAALAIRPTEFYRKHSVSFQHGRVTSIHPGSRTVTLDNGDCLPYTKLALCMGSRARPLDIAGAGLEGVHYLRTITDVESIKSEVRTGRHAVIIGGGYIGLETAAVLRKLGMHVTILEAGQRVLQRVTAQEVSHFFQRVHEEEGVSIHCSVAVSALEGRRRIERVVCSDGTEIAADMVIIGVGILPNVELAEAAGLVTDNGITVDACCRTSDPDIVAAGDCSNQFNGVYARRLRLESAPNALEQGKLAAAAICGIDKQSPGLPWFWSDQYDMKLQIAGLNLGHDQVITRGSPQQGRSFAAFYFLGGRLIAADCVNRPQEFMFARRCIPVGGTIDPAICADESVPVKEFMNLRKPAEAGAAC